MTVILICPCYLVVSPCSLSKSYIGEIYLGPCGCRQQDALRDANILVLTIECTPRYSSRTRTKRLVGSRAVGPYTSLIQIRRTSEVFVVPHTPSLLLKDPARSRPTHTHIRLSGIGPGPHSQYHVCTSACCKADMKPSWAQISRGNECDIQREV